MRNIVMSTTGVWILLCFVIGLLLRAESQRLTRLRKRGDSTVMGVALLFMGLGVYLVITLVVGMNDLRRAFGL